jgi:hypothetical protein
MDDLRVKALKLAGELPKGSEARREILGALQREGADARRVLKLMIEKQGRAIEALYTATITASMRLPEVKEEITGLRRDLNNFGKKLGRHLKTEVNVWVDPPKNAWFKPSSGRGFSIVVHGAYGLEPPPDDQEDLEDAIYNAITGGMHNVDISY